MKVTTPEDNLFMQRCIELAMNGALDTPPNPMVGCVVVANGKIIGEGWHQKYGGPHAEVNAIRSVKETDLLPNATLYVNLEPCSHYGKTPPCADLIIQKGIRKVVIGNIDPHEKVSGKGIDKLEKAGCHVITGLMEKECLELNKMFFTYHTKKRPYIILKWAESADGFIDRVRNVNDPVGPHWISNEQCRQMVHKWRAECQAIMVGANTIKKDNPLLNVRSWPGKNPLRVIIDKHLDIPAPSNIYKGETPTLVFNYTKSGLDKNITYVQIGEKENPLDLVMKTLYSKEVISLLVEGGTKLISEFINHGLWDEARIFKGEQYFHEGVEAPFPIHSFRKDDTVFDTHFMHLHPKFII